MSIDESIRIKKNQLDKRLDFIRSAHNEKKENEIRTDRMEDYLEVIYELIQQKGYATTADISKYLNVSSPSVTKMVKKLDENRYLIYEKYRGLSLTIEGTHIAKNIQEKQKLFSAYPETIVLSKNILQNTLNATEGEEVVVAFSNDFRFKGTVISNKRK